jgi:flavin-dependent dehydrogenase
VRRAVFPERPGPRTAIAIQVRLAAGADLEAHEVFFSSRHTDFYAWAIPKPGAVLIGSAFGDPHGARRRFEDLLARMRESLALGGKVLERSARGLGRPCARRELFGGAGPVLLAGEAAGLVSPSSGEGISFALESGAAAGEAVGRPQPSRHYAGVFRHLARRVRRKFLKARVIFSPRCRRAVLRLPWCP